MRSDGAQKGHKLQLSQFHSAKRQHAVCDSLDLLGTPLHDDDFKAVMVVQMDVGGRKNHRTGYMLSLCQLLREVWNMVIVDKRECADDLLVRVNRLS